MVSTHKCGILYRENNETKSFWRLKEVGPRGHDGYTLHVFSCITGTAFYRWLALNISKGEKRMKAEDATHKTCKKQEQVWCHVTCNI